MRRVPRLGGCFAEHTVLPVIPLKVKLIPHCLPNSVTNGSILVTCEGGGKQMTVVCVKCGR